MQSNAFKVLPLSTPSRRIRCVTFGISEDNLNAAPASPCCVEEAPGRVGRLMCVK